MNRAILAMAVFLGLAAVVRSETCTTNDQCTGTICNTGFHVVCEHPAGSGVSTNGGLCTCAQDDLYCRVKDDCLSTNSNVNLPCGDLRRHCYDNKCICSRW